MKRIGLLLLILVALISVLCLSSCSGKELTVNFEGNGGTLISGAQSQSVKKGGGVTPPIYERAGYTLSWNASLDEINESVTLKAVWTPVVYTVTYILDGGTNHAANPSTFTVESEAITLLAPTKAGFVFGGFQEGGTIPANSVGNKTFTALWSMQCTYTFYDVDGITVLKTDTVTAGSTIIPPANPTKAPTAQYSYSFSGWDKAIPLTITDDITFTAAYSETVNRYTYTFYDEDGTTVLKTATEDFGAQILPPSAAKTGTQQYSYFFIGWNKTIPDNLTENISFIAAYSRTVNQYTYTFYDEDGTTVLQSETLYYGSAIYAPSEPVKTSTQQYHYTFSGWDKTVPDILTENIAFTAQFNANLRTYTVTFLFNEENILPTRTLYYNDTVTEPEEPIEDYEFYGWFSDEAYTAPYEFGSPITSDIVIYIRLESLSFVAVDGGYGVWGHGSITKKDITVPSTYKGQPVVGIEESAFYYTDIETVTLPQSIKYIGAYAFNNSKLKSISIPGNVESIGASAFRQCADLTQVTLGSGIKTVGAYAFSETPVASVSIPGSIQTISEYAFCSCLALTEVVLGVGVKTIDNGAFSWCNALSSLTLPEGLTDIGETAFGRCESLTQVTLPQTLKTIGSSAFSVCALTSISIPGSVKTISDDAFHSNFNLESLVIGEGVETIGKFAFYGAGNEELSLPDSIKTIAEGGFSHASLNNVVIGSGIESIGTGAFNAGITFTFKRAIPPTIAADTFYYPTKFIVPLSAVTAYRTADVWSGYAAKITAKLFVSFETNGGSEIEPSEVWYEGTVAPPQNVEKPGYEVSGWYTDAELTDEFNFGTILTSNITLYAKWAPKKYTVSFVTNDGTDIPTIQAEYGSVVDVDTNKSGFVFFGWYSDEAMRQPQTTVPAQDATLYGGWYNEGLEFAIVNNEYYEVSIGTSTGDLLLIPTMYAGLPVTAIGEYGFSCGEFSAVVIPYGITAIGLGGFDSCWKLLSVTIPSSVTTIGGEAFYCCESLSSVIIQQGVTTIGYQAFYECESLGSITIPGSVTAIGDEAFSGCEALSSVIIEQGVTTLGEEAFYNCTSLGSLIIPKSVTAIGEEAFAYITASITFAEDSAISTIGSNAFGYYYGDSLIIPAGVTAIEDYAFYRSTAAVSFAETSIIDTIGYEAFRYYDGESVILPDSITRIAGNAFSNCIYLTSIIIPDSVESIEEGAFRNCSLLKSITIPIGVLNMSANIITNAEVIFAEAAAKPDGWAVGWNPNNIPVYWGITENNYTVINDTEYVLSGVNATLVRYLGNAPAVTVPSQVTFGVNPVTVDTIAKDAFKSADRLQCVKIPSNISVIGENAFASDDLVIYAEAAAKPEGWHQNWISLYKTSCVYYGSVFDEIVEQDGMQFMLSDGNAVLTKHLGRSGAANIPSQVTIGGIARNVTSIATLAFSDPTQLKTILIPQSVINIAEKAFRIDKIAILAEASAQPSGWHEYWYPIFTTPVIYWKIQKSDFAEQDGLHFLRINTEATLIKYAGAGSAVTVPAEVTIGTTLSVTAIGESAFDYCKTPTSITLPFGLRIIGNYAFYGCYNLPSLEIPSTVTEIGKSSFSYCVKLASVTIPVGVKTINDGAFQNSGLTSIVLPIGITKLGNGIFANCVSLNTATLPSDITYIPSFTFAYCSRLTAVVLPLGVKDIRGYAFADCPLSSITIPNGVDTIDSNAFLYRNELTIYAGAAEEPSGWNLDGRPVVWGCNISEESYVLSFTKSASNPEGAANYNPYREGYVFNGWYTEENLTGERYFNISDAPYGVLYADWIPQE